MSGHIGKDELSVNVDLAQGYAFYPDANTPPAVVTLAFGDGDLHQCRYEGSWDFDKAAASKTARVVRSFRTILSAKGGAEWEDIIFQYGPRAFICGDSRRIVAYAGKYEEAEQLVLQFTQSFVKDSAVVGGAFHLLKEEYGTIRTQEVALPANTLLPRESIAVQYPAGTPEWLDRFLALLRERRHGLSIFEGLPGTGKTSFLRHLAGALRATHRFYFIPASAVGLLTNPNMTAFWSGQRRLYADRHFVVILEDADAALMNRAGDNREQVNAILNLCDGLLADFLHLHIICTINCRTSEIDPALVRPGRLIAHRVFKQLTYIEACRLAAHIGGTLNIKRDYTMAEVFAGEAISPTTPAIGFR